MIYFFGLAWFFAHEDFYFEKVKGLSPHRFIVHFAPRPSVDPEVTLVHPKVIHLILPSIIIIQTQPLKPHTNNNNTVSTCYKGDFKTFINKVLISPPKL